MRLAKRQSLCQREQMRRSASYGPPNGVGAVQPRPTTAKPRPSTALAEPPQPSEAGCGQLRRSLAQGGRDFGGG
jgi:hypothetical protein